MKGEDRRWCVNDGWSRRWKSFSMHSCGSNVSTLDAYERFLARFSCVRHLEWGLATNRGGHARGRTWISPPASFDVPGRSEVRGTAILRDRSGSQVALWLENRRCAGVGITLFHVRSPGELLSLSPVTMHAYDCRDVASIQIFYIYIYICIFFSRFLMLFIFLFFIYLFFESFLVDWFLNRTRFLTWTHLERGPNSLLSFERLIDTRWGKKRKRRTSLFTEIAAATVLGYISSRSFL